jgi:carotenoid cleavage dioxygenase-like enzyme
VPWPRDSSEDDGVVIAPGIDAEGHGIMVVLDAASWTEAARVQLPFGVANRFHGLWMQS